MMMIITTIIIIINNNDNANDKFAFPLMHTRTHVEQSLAETAGA